MTQSQFVSLRKSTHSVQIWENTDQKNSVFEHFSRIAFYNVSEQNLLNL